MTAQAFRQALEDLGFECREEHAPGERVFQHSAFSRNTAPSTSEFVEHSSIQVGDCQDGLSMPDVSYNPALNPLEVRVKCSRAAASLSESWQVVIASSLQPVMTSSDRVASYFLHDEQSGGSDKSTPSEADVYLDLERPLNFTTSTSTSSSQEKEADSYSWIARQSESSSLCLDDLTDIDILSQISAYYG